MRLLDRLCRDQNRGRVWPGYRSITLLQESIVRPREYVVDLQVYVANAGWKEGGMERDGRSAKRQSDS